MFKERKKVVFIIVFFLMFFLNVENVDAVIANANYCKYTVNGKLVEIAPDISYSDGSSQKITVKGVSLGSGETVSSDYFKFDVTAEQIIGCPKICFSSSDTSVIYFHTGTGSLCDEKIGVGKYQIENGSVVIGHKIVVDPDGEGSGEVGNDEEEDDGYSSDEAIDVSCDGLFTPQALELINEILGYLRILAPIALIVLVAQDFAVAVILNNNDALKKATGKVTKRSIALIAFFLVPTFIQLILGLPGIKDYLESMNIGKDIFCTNATGTEANALPSNYWKIGYSPDRTPGGAGDFNFTEEISGKKLDKPLVEALAEKGNTIDDLNQCIYNKVLEYGPGTRSGVGAASVGLIQCMLELTNGYVMCYDHHGGKRYGGGYTSNMDIYGKLGVNSNWGVSYGGTRLGLNCATSTLWGLCNGGLNVCSGVSGSEAYAHTITGNTKFGGRDGASVQGLLQIQTVIFDPYNSGDRGTYPGGDVYSGQVGDMIFFKNSDVDNTAHAMLIVGKDEEGYWISENGRNTKRIPYSDIENGKPLRAGVKRYYQISILENYYNNPSSNNGLYGLGSE